MRSLLAFLTTLPLTASWDYFVLSGATESSFVSRSIQLSDVFQERTFVAYLETSGLLAVARYHMNGFTPVTSPA